MKKSKIAAKICCYILLAALLISAGGFWWIFGTEIKAASGITRLENGLYSLEYIGDYGFDLFLSQGGAESDSEVALFLSSYLSHGLLKADSRVKTEEAGCSTVCIKDSSGVVSYGRNFDWSDCSALIVHTKPKNGYESFSTCCIDFLGFSDSYTPVSSMMNRIQALSAIYVPLDGMNEKGLMVADLMAGDEESTHQNTDKPDLTTTTMIRLLLDKAADVDEAIELLKQYDMHSSMGAAHHLSIADASGRSIAAEYVNGELIIVETPIVTNHYLSACEKYGIGSEQSHIRYDTLNNALPSADTDSAYELLEAVAQKNYPQSEGSYEKTMWSIVYHPQALTADFFFRENYSHSYGLILKEKGSFLKK